MTTSTDMTGGTAVVKSLIAHGVDTIFGLPGVQNDGLYNALYDHKAQIRVIHPRHEQGAGYMALGYALATGGKAVFSVVPGPGVLNASAALATAYSLNAQVLCLTGQIPSHLIGKGTGMLHELPDQLGIIRLLTKWAERINTGADSPRLVAEAFYQMGSGLTQPVGLEVAMDVLKRTEAVGDIVSPKQVVFPEVDVDMVGNAGILLAKSKRPLIYVGGGAQNVSPEVTQLATMLEAPVVGYRTGHGVLDSRHYLSTFLPPSHELWQTADVVLAIGTNMRTPLQDWGTADDMTIIRIDVDATAHDRILAPDLAITARAEDVLPMLLETVATHNISRTSRKDDMLALRAAWDKQTAYLEPQKTYINLMRDVLGEDGVFVDELTQVGYASRIMMPVYKPRTFISTGYQGTLGYGFPTGLGIKVAKPNTPVLSIVGDGGFLFTSSELATAVQHRIGLVTVLFNNNQYGNVQQMQRNLYGGRVIATDLVNPDFVKMAESFGARAVRVAGGEKGMPALRRAIEAGFASDLPTVIEVPMGAVPTVDKFRKLGKARGS